MSTADALIAVADTIISRAEGLSTVAINKKGRKFKYVNDAFQRVQEEDKHLVIYPQDLSESLATISAFSILESIDTRLFADFQDVCLTVVGVAGEIERRGWYEEEHSSVIPYKQSKFNYDMDMRKKALEFAKGLFHTDHHIGNKLDDPYMRDYVEQFYGAEAVSSPEVIVALKSFVHWANIKGILWKLRVPNLDMSESLIDRFSSFPDPPAELLDVVWSRYPSGRRRGAFAELKIPQFTDELIDEYESYHNKLVAASTKIDEYIAKGWDDDDIVLRLYNSNTRNIHDEVNSMRDAFAEDYE
ncbi:hypothetical protein CJJ09_004892 [Candidozyma auris]|nr:hypothetical protein CJJ09_004892 [[Candida] auris]